MKIIVIGGGPGGYVAALKAAILGAETILIEKEKVGGTCLNKGCIPTKSLLNSVSVLDEIKACGEFGIRCGAPSADYGKILERKNRLVKQLVEGVGFLLKKRGVQVISGYGRLLKNKTVEVSYEDGGVKEIQGDIIILATGSKPVVHASFKYDGINVITSDETLDLEKIPESMLIVGGGVIGCEFGQFFCKMGCKVAIVEMEDRILPAEDSEAAAALYKALMKDSIKIITGTKVEDVQVKDNCVAVALSNGEHLNVEKMLISVGRRALIDEIGIDEAGIGTKRGKIVVNDKMQTNQEGIYAIGDVVDSPALAHVASREAVVAVENAFGRDTIMTYHAVPRCVYTEPEIAGAGMTEEQAIKAGVDYRTGKFSLAGLGKAMVIGKTGGVVKVLADESGKIIGASIVGPHATDMITEITAAVQLGLSVKQMGGVIHPHPTMSEAILEAINDINKESVHSF